MEKSERKLGDTYRSDPLPSSVRAHRNSVRRQGTLKLDTSMSQITEGKDDDDNWMLKDIAERHKENSLIGSIKSLRNTKEYQQKVEFQIPLHQLYELQAVCLHTHGADYCGALVRIEDEKVINLNKGMPFLL